MTVSSFGAVNYSAWQLTDTAVLAELRELMALTDADTALLASMHEAARAVVPQLAEAFYVRLMRHPLTADYLANTSLEARHSTISQWFLDLFSGNYDDQYVAKRIVIGKVHVRIGLPVRYPLAMLDVVLEYGEQVARQNAQPAQALAAFRKLLALDVAVFNQAYEDNQIEHLAELVGGKRLARLLLTGGA